MANSFTDTLLKEAEALSLRCFDLVPSEKGDEVSAHWGGHRSDLPEELPEFVQAYEAAKHFLSVDQKLFDQLELQGRGPLALEMFTTVEGGDVLNNVNVSTGNLNEVSFEESVPLKAKPATSLPPFEALMLYGGPVVQDWLKSQKLERWRYSDVSPQSVKSIWSISTPNSLSIHQTRRKCESAAGISYGLMTTSTSRGR